MANCRFNPVGVAVLGAAAVLCSLTFACQPAHSGSFYEREFTDPVVVPPTQYREWTVRPVMRPDLYDGVAVYPYSGNGIFAHYWEHPSYLGDPFCLTPTCPREPPAIFEPREDRPVPSQNPPSLPPAAVPVPGTFWALLGALPCLMLFRGE